MTTRPYTDADYAEISRWWAAHKFPVPAPRFLSPRGFVAVDGETPMAAVWLYKTDSAFGWMEWLVANPDSSPRKRPDAIRAVVREARRAAKDLGIEAIHTSVSDKTPSLKRLYGECGFALADDGMSNFIAGVE